MRSGSWGFLGELLEKITAVLGRRWWYNPEKQFILGPAAFTLTLTISGNLESLGSFQTNACFWTVGGGWRTQREPTQNMQPHTEMPQTFLPWGDSSDHNHCVDLSHLDIYFISKWLVGYWIFPFLFYLPDSAVELAANQWLQHAAACRHLLCYHWLQKEDCSHRLKLFCSLMPTLYIYKIPSI